MVETLAAAGLVALVRTLWKVSSGQELLSKTIETGIAAVVKEVQALRKELGDDIARLEEVTKDHEFRLRGLEKNHEG